MPINFKKLFVAAVFIFPVSICQAQTASINMNNDPVQLLEEPPIWSISDEDSEVILYPTIHILSQDVRWHSPRLTAAINRAEEIWYELPVGAQNDQVVQTMAKNLGFSPNRPLSKVLTGETYDKLRDAARKLDIPIMSMEPMRPWMASITLPVVQLTKAGYNPELGVEVRLQSMVKNKPTKFFETAEQQLRFLSDLSEKDQIQLLESVLEDTDQNILDTEAMVKAWSQGDIEYLEDEILAEMKTELPTVYDVMFLKRNKAWVEMIDAEMKGDGVDFIAVGAGHLVGVDGLPEMLRQKGYDVKILTER